MVSPNEQTSNFHQLFSMTLVMRSVSAMQKCSETPPEDARRGLDMILSDYIEDRAERPSGRFFALQSWLFSTPGY